MLMNKIETFAVNNPARRALQRYGETPMLRRLGGRTPSARIEQGSADDLAAALHAADTEDGCECGPGCTDACCAGENCGQ